MKMWKSTVGAVAVAVLALVGAGCASSGQSAGTVPSLPDDHQGGVGQQAPGSELAVAHSVQGQWLMDAAVTDQPRFRVRLDMVRCGSGHIFNLHFLAVNAASEGSPAPAVPKPNPGSQFCLVRYSVVNRSASNQPWLAYMTTVNVGQNAFSSDDGHVGSSVSTAYSNYAQPQYKTADFGLNPGARGVSWAVFQIPKHVTPTTTSVEFNTTDAGGHAVVVQVKQVQRYHAPPPLAPVATAPAAPASDACTTIPGYFSGGLPGHLQNGFCYPYGTHYDPNAPDSVGTN